MIDLYGCGYCGRMTRGVRVLIPTIHGNLTYSCVPCWRTVRDRADEW